MAVNNFDVTSLNIVHWNANGIRRNLSEIRQFILDHNVDILLLNETRLNSNVKFNILGYDSVRKDRVDGSSGGGVMILIKQSVQYTEIPVNTNSLETVAIKLSNNLIIISLYNPPTSKIKPNDLNILNNLGNKLLIFGDLNAKNNSWNCKSNNANGRIILDFSFDNMFKIIAPNGFTLYPYNGGAPSTVDIGLVRNLKCDISLEILDKLNSDHLPVKIGLVNSDKMHCLEKTFFNYKKANWKIFRDIVNENLTINQRIKSINDIETSIGNLVTVISNASSKAIPIVKGTGGKHHILPPNIKALITARYKLRKLWQRTGNNEVRKIKNKLSNTINKKIAEFNNNNWSIKLNNLNTRDNSLWKMAKCFKRKDVNSIPTLRGPDGLVHSNTDKANLLAAHYEKLHHMTTYMGDDDTEKLANAKCLDILNAKIPIGDIELTIPKEVKRAIMNTKSKKAPGLDGIQNIVLKNLPRKALVQIMYICNASLTLSHFPDAWKTANVLPFLKSGKDKSLAASYRPISLLPTLSKILEKIIYNRIINFESENKLLIPEQFGFRRRRSTLHQLLRLTNQISTNFNKNKSTALVLLDLEKAFDTVWTEGLIYKLDSFKFPPYILKILLSYLKDRKFVVTVKDTRSEQQKVVAGVPQGTILGPVLFIFFINVIPRSNTQGGIPCDSMPRLSIFADDTAAYVSSLSKKLAVTKLQTYTKLLLEFFHKWKLKVNIEKTNFIIFTKRIKEN